MSKKTQHVSTAQIHWLMLFKEIIAVYSESDMKPIHILFVKSRLFTVKVGGMYSRNLIIKVKCLFLIDVS
jgi:hypothetical protein